jgi:predicted outer membrane protein
MVEVKINLEVSAQRMIEQITMHNEEIKTLIEQQVKTACKKLDEFVGKPDFQKSLDQQIEESVNQAIKNALQTYGMKDHIDREIKRIVEAKLKVLMDATIK